MKPVLSILLTAALAAASASGARAQGDDGQWEVDYDWIADTGQQLFDEFAPESVKAEYRPMTASELQDTFAPLESALAEQSMGALAALQPQARQTLAELRADPETQPYADWLQARMDYFEMAAEAEQAVSPSKPRPAPAPSARVPPNLPPHPKPSPADLPPHPKPRPADLPPHPKPPEPATTPAPKKPGAVETARNRYVESRASWLRKLADRPPPARAAALLPDLKRIFQEEGVPPQLVWQAEAESTFNPSARSPAGAVGLYQFMPATAREFGLQLAPRDERLDAAKNARAAARYLKKLHARFGSWELALAAYNCGQGRVSKTLRAAGGSSFADIHDRLPAETRMYVPKIAALVKLREQVDLDRL